MSPNLQDGDRSRQQRNTPIVPAVPRTFEKPARLSRQSLRNREQNSLNKQDGSHDEAAQSEAGEGLQIDITGDLVPNVGTDDTSRGFQRKPEEHVRSQENCVQHKGPSSVELKEQPLKEVDHDTDWGHEQSMCARPGAVSVSTIATEPTASERSQAVKDQRDSSVTTDRISSSQDIQPSSSTSPESPRQHEFAQETRESNRIEFAPSDSEHISLCHPPTRPQPINRPSVSFESHFPQTLPPNPTCAPPAPPSNADRGPQCVDRQHLAQDLGYYTLPPFAPSTGVQPPYSPSDTPLAPPFPQTNGAQVLPSNVQLSEPQSSHGVAPTIRRPSQPPLVAQSCGSHYHQASNDPEHSAPLIVPPTLSEHALQNFNNPHFADCRLILTHSEGRFPPATWLVHTLLLARSAKLRALLMNGQYGYDLDGLKVMQIHLTDRFITPLALEAALLVLYDEPVSKFTGFAATKATPSRTKADFSMSWMKDSVAYAAAGHLLSLGDVVARGLEIASKILNWDNLENALSFSLAGAEHCKQSPSASAVPNDTTSLAYESDSSVANTILTPNTSQDSATSSPGLGIDRKLRLVGDAPLPAAVRHADDLLLRCLQYIANHFPQSWHFDRHAKPLSHVDRLPLTNESISLQAKAKLSKIQFGDLPSETPNSASNHDSFISSILLSLPFASLQIIATWEKGLIKQNLPQIVEERESRRTLVLNSGILKHPWTEVVNHSQWSEVGYKESVESVNASPQLSRIWVGFSIDKGSFRKR